MARWAISGSHGLIGSALVEALTGQGHVVVRLPRDASVPSELAEADVVVHLAGAGIGDRRWNPDRRAELVRSRVETTASLSTALARAGRPGAVLIVANAVGYYGADRGGEFLTEDSTAGTGFLAELCVRWQEAAEPARAAGLRVVHLRTGLVLSAAGGVLARMLPLFRAGLGARLGAGRQWQSWITRADAVAAIVHLAAAPGAGGPVNLVAPDPVTNAELTAALGRALRRPARLRVPAAVLRAALGREMADETVLAGQRVLPAALQGSGYSFLHPDLSGALEAALADRARRP
jgi:uncharacterized protein (TIGR01777 family)